MKDRVYKLLFKDTALTLTHPHTEGASKVKRGRWGEIERIIPKSAPRPGRVFLRSGPGPAGPEARGSLFEVWPRAGRPRGPGKPVRNEPEHHPPPSDGG